MGSDLYLGFFEAQQRSSTFVVGICPLEKLIAFVQAASGGKFTAEDVKVYVHIQEQYSSCSSIKEQDLSFAWWKVLSALPLDRFLSWGRASHYIPNSIWDDGSSTDKALITKICDELGYDRAVIPMIDLIYWG